MIGKIISHYKILEKLGEGGMGVVFKAEDTKLKRNVALKFLPPNLTLDTEAKERFMHEARAASALDHPNICTVFEVNETDDGQMYLAMALYEGQTLQKKIENGPLPLEEAIDIAQQIANGLEKAHQKEIVHRDLKPANIIITNDGLVKILDFGLAKLQGQTRLTKEGTTLGTTHYMSPEQVRGEMVDRKTDIWALGAIVYEMITGQTPFKGEYDQAVMYAIVNEEPEAMTSLRSAVPMELERIVNKALKKNTAERYQQIGEMRVDLKSLSSEPSAEKIRASSKKARKAALIAGLLFLIALVLGSSFYYWGQSSPERQDTQQISVQRLAVLPFTNIREDPQTDFLGFALADQIIGSLSYLKNILVRPSSSIRPYQNPALNRQTAGADLKVDIILTGNYLKEGNTIRLNLELIDVDANEMIWREPIEVEYENAFALQDIVSEKVIKRLKLQFSQDERTRMQSNVSQNPLAYEYYLRSLSYPEEAEGNRLAVNMLRKSIELDSTFAPAWGALGRRTHLIAYWGLGGEEVAKQAKNFYLKALGINPQLFSALLHLTMLYTDFGETDLAMETAQQMLEIDPNSASGMFAYGYVLRYAGMT
ncbi:MAG: protein kinase, partial [bacterium]